MTLYVNGKFNVNNHAHILRGKESCLTKWIYYSFQHRNILPHITKQGATRYKLNKERLQEILLLVPGIEMQKLLISKFDAIEASISNIQLRINTSKALRSSLINHIF